MLVLRKALMAAAASGRIRDAVMSAPGARGIVDRYVAGESSEDAVAAARELRSAGLLVTLDYLGEDTTDAQRAAATAAQYVHLLGKLAAEGLTEDGAVEVSVKPTALGLLLGTEADVRELATPGTRVRLCKGAYAEPVAEAFESRHEVDKSFARCLRILMTGPGYPMIATHDPRLIDITRALGLARPADSFEYQMLHGVRPDEQRRLAAAGAKVRVYVPYGGDWYPYLVRRLAERPANLALFLRSLRSKS